MSVEINLSNLNAKADQIKRLSQPGTMEKIGQKVIELNMAQIRGQQDAAGNPFPAYTPRWQEWRSKHKRNPGVVDLTISGAMLAGLGVVRVQEGEVEVGFNSVSEKRKAKGELYNKKRPIRFVGLHDKSREKLFEWIRERFLRVNS